MIAGGNGFKQWLNTCGQAEPYGIDASSVAGMLSWALRGAMLPDYETEAREQPIYMLHRLTHETRLVSQPVQLDAHQPA